MQIKRIGLDLAKYVFEVHAVDDDDQVVLRKTLRRDAVAQFFAEMEPCIAGMEACCGSHYWARVLTDLGHECTIDLASVREALRQVKQERSQLCRGNL